MSHKSQQIFLTLINFVMITMLLLNFKLTLSLSRIYRGSRSFFNASLIEVFTRFPHQILQPLVQVLCFALQLIHLPLLFGKRIAVFGILIWAILLIPLLIVFYNSLMSLLLSQIQFVNLVKRPRVIGYPLLYLILEQ